MKDKRLNLFALILIHDGGGVVKCNKNMKSGPIVINGKLTILK